MLVEVLYFDGCPAFDELLPRLRALIGDEEISLRRITTPAEAQIERFLGSPTVRADDVDVEPNASERDDFGIKCRLYPAADGLRHTPTDAMLTAALSRAFDRERSTQR